MNIPPEVTLPEVAEWQLAPSQDNLFRVELPKLQRGFVWEPSKVADLWDSILRGFPIGSMMVSNIEPELQTDPGTAQRYMLLDGQQRATSIAIGFYNPWNPQSNDPSMWSLKSIPILWLDLEPTRRHWDVKMFSPYLVTQSHPWGYNQDGGVIPWGKRRHACEALGLGADYSTADLSVCLPWEANLPIPMPILLEVANSDGMRDPSDFWDELGKQAGNLSASWKSKFGERMTGEQPGGLDKLFQRLRRVPAFRVHLNLLTGDAEENDDFTADDNSLLFVRLNTGGVVLGGEELIFSLFKSAFPRAKDAVEDCATGFMAPSKLFGLLVRLAAAKEYPAKLARPVTLRDFKKEIRSPDLPLKQALEDLIHKEDEDAVCEAARLITRARAILCGSQDSPPAFCLPQAVATRSINESPDIFLALLYWLRCGGDVEFGSEEHRRLLGRYTALSWFLPGNARAKQDALREWIATAGNDVAGHLWSGECLSFLFTRKELAVPLFPLPEQFKDLLLKGLLEVEPYDYENLPASAPGSFWDGYKLLFIVEDETDEIREQRLWANLMSFTNQLWKCRTMLLYAQRDYIRKRFVSFGQWELTLKDTNCPWDWDHIYPSASGLHNVDKVYRDWHNTIGNLRAEGLSENRRDGCNTPTEKLALEDADGTPGWQNSFIRSDIWDVMQSLKYQHNAIKNRALAREICGVVLKRMVSIYEEWHGQLRIAPLMDEVRNAASDARNQ